MHQTEYYVSDVWGHDFLPPAIDGDGRLDAVLGANCGASDRKETRVLCRSFDYIIVGAGSAGCVLANRLSADPATRVLLIEAGLPDKSLMISMPKGFAKLVEDTTYVRQFQTTPAATAGSGRKPGRAE